MGYDYCLYARKSTESDEKQALSIDSQIKEMTAIAKRDGLKIVEIKKESHSAKESGTRPVFNEIVQELKRDKYQGLITWAPDRLSRCAGDLGILIDLMDQKHLSEIRTYSQMFTNTPNDKFLLMILGSQAKFENDSRAVNVVRGMKTKCEMGHRPCMPPLGYLNTKHPERGMSRIVLDPIRAPIVKEMFERSANGESGRDIIRWASEQGFTNRKGKPIPNSTFFNMISNPYYYGEFEWPKGTGNWYKVGHESIITKELFDRVRDRVSDMHKGIYGSKEFDFTGMFKCGTCGCGVSAAEKFKNISDGTRRRYVYYVCTKGTRQECKQPYIREELLIEELIGLMDKIDINKVKGKEKLEREIEKYNKFTRGVIGKEFEVVKSSKLDLKTYAKYVLREGNRDEKRELLSCLNTTIYINNRKLYLSTEEMGEN